jgi:hypothetical protein
MKKWCTPTHPFYSLTVWANVRIGTAVAATQTQLGPVANKKVAPFCPCLAELAAAPAPGPQCGCPRLLSIAIWIVVLLGLVEKVNINQTSDFWQMAGMNPL